MLSLVLFAQAIPAPPADFIKDHPTIVAWTLGLLCSVVVAEAVMLGAWVRSKFSDIKEQLAEHRNHVDENHRHIEAKILTCGEAAQGRFNRVEERMDSVEKDLIEYREHVGAGDVELRRLSERITRHLDEEEKQVWGTMREIQASLADMKVENVEAHGSIIAGRTQLVAEVAALNARVSSIEPKVTDIHRDRPNGSLKEIAQLLERVIENQKKQVPPKKRAIRGEK